MAEASLKQALPSETRLADHGRTLTANTGKLSANDKAGATLE